MSVYIKIAGRNLIQARRRSLLVGLALALVTMLLVVLMSWSKGLTETMFKAATTLSAGHVNVAGFFKAKEADSIPLITGTKKLRALIEANTPDLDYLIDRRRGWARVISESSSMNVGLTGIDIDEESRFLTSIQLAKESDYLADGRDEILGDVSKLKEPGFVMIFSAQAKRLGVVVGDPLTLTTETMSGSRNTGDAVIAAIAKDVGYMSNWSVFTGKETIGQLYDLSPDVSGAVQVYLKDPSKSAEVMGHLVRVLTDEGYTLMEHDPQPFWMKFEVVAGEDWTGQKLDLTIWSDEVSFLQWVLNAVDGVSFVLVSILVVIIAVGIMNSMWMSVRERTSEVGTLRAIGMSRGRVLFMFLLEALILAFFSTVVGSLLGAGLALAVDAAHIHVPFAAIRAILMSDTVNFVVGLPQLAIAVGVFTSIAGLAALWPAHMASRMQPVTAIHQAQ
ncbi:MAG: ABC transporter permease [Deltaproteobacteria bacterium]|nr:ABC transporter permease [Deltaproteobacteria bacterium]